MSASSETVRIIRVFVSSPGDVAEERAAMEEVVASINRTDGEAGGFRLELFRWEDNVTPQIGPKPQAVVDSQTPLYDVYVGILAHRFGTRTGRYGSGTDKEFRDALRRWSETGKPWILFYFRKGMVDPDLLDLAQYAKVRDFREHLESKGRGLYATYEGVRGNKGGFVENVEKHLRKVARRLLAAESPKKDTSVAAPTSTKPIVPSEYTEWLLGRCGDVELMGLELKHGSGVRLNHVYTPLATSSRPEETERGKSGRDVDEMAGEHESKQLLLALLDKQSLYVSGDPGSGKSTFCRWVTWLVGHDEMPTVDVPAPGEYQETFPDELRGRLPVLVRLRDFWQHLPARGVRAVALGSLEHALEVWLVDQKYPGMNWPCLKGHLDHGSALLMLDGVDEVPPIRKLDGDEWYPREMLLRGLAEAVAQWSQAGNRVLVTSRPYGLNSEQQRQLGLTHAPILGLDQRLQALLVRRWFLRLKEEPGLATETADAMIDHIHMERGLDDLAANPLLLTAMCIIYDEGKRLPHDKYLLYDRIVDTVLHKRYAERERIDPIRGRLSAVAYGMHTGAGLGQERATPEAAVSDSEIDAILQAYHQLDGATDKGLSDTVRVREDLLSQSGLLVSRDDDNASFYHLSIQEFLAAERLHLLHIRKWESLIALMSERGMNTGWRNTLSFLFGCLIAKSNPHVGIECLQEIASRLSWPTAAPSREGGEDGVWKLAIFLCDCLQILAGREAAVPEDLNNFFQTGISQAIEQEIAVKDRHMLAVALGRLGDPCVTVDLRVTGHPDGHLGYVKIPAGQYKIGDEKKQITIDEPYWLSKHPVTNSQYALFVDDDGYSRQEFWSEGGWQWVQGEGVKAPDYWRNSDFNAPNQPVVRVSWWEAEAYCTWAGVRLPTEDQWEAAARGPESSKYPWGEEWEDGICNSHEAGLGGTSAVGIFPRDLSPFGVMDMAGNVWEWCQDLWSTGASSRVIRGGSWGNDARYCRAAFRYRSEPQGRSSYLGFRVAAVPPGGGATHTPGEPGA